MISRHRTTSWSRLRSAALAVGLGALTTACAGSGEPGKEAVRAGAEDDAGDPFTQIDRVEVLSLEDVKERARQLADDLDLQGADRDVAVIQSQFDQIYPSLQRLLIIEEDIRKLLVTLGGLPADQLGLEPGNVALSGVAPAAGPTGPGPQTQSPKTQTAAPPPAPEGGGAGGGAARPARGGPHRRRIGTAPPTPSKTTPAKNTPTKTGPTKTGPAKTGPAKTGLQKPAPAPDAPAQPVPDPAARDENLFGDDFGGTEIPITDLPFTDSTGPTSSTTKGVPGGTWAVHVGSYRLTDSARRDLVLMRRDLGGQLRGLEVLLSPVPGTGGTERIERLLLGPLSSRGAAEALCAAFKAAGHYCAPHPFIGDPL